MRTLRLNMSGTDVMEVQATLQKLGYYGGEPDGIFGPQTQRSVSAFQAYFGLDRRGHRAADMAGFAAFCSATIHIP